MTLSFVQPPTADEYNAAKPKRPTVRMPMHWAAASAIAFASAAFATWVALALLGVA